MKARLRESEVAKYTMAATYKSRNGRRINRDFAVSETVARFPETRAQCVSQAHAWGDDRGWRLVNWAFNVDHEQMVAR